MAEYVIRVVASASGEPAPFGAFVAAYSPNAHEGRGHVEVTRDPAKARRFKSQADAWELWRATAAPPYHRRADGKPNRPLTAWTVAVEPA